MSNLKTSNITAIMFGLLLLTILPGTVKSYSPLIKSVLAQEGNNGNLSAASNQSGIPITTSTQNDSQERIPTQEGFSTKVLATNLSEPHNIIYGPDNILWITERQGKNITLIDPKNGTILNSIPIPNVHQSSQTQDGLMGMVLDPDFNNTNHIYVAYTYDGADGEGLERLTKITRFTYDPAAGTITEPMDLISGLQGSIDHNGGRLAFGPDGKLYYTIGDQGKNQLSLYCMDIEAQTLPIAEDIANQNWTDYQGKVLRMNLDGSIPEDNPIIDGLQSHIFTFGHRNHQGLAIGPNGDMYVTEHGPDSDDEVNRLIAGGNYGWPYVAGFKDGNAYQYVNWSSAGENCSTLDYFSTEPEEAGLAVQNESEFNASNFVPPVATFYTVEDDYNFTDHTCGELAYVCNPTIAPSSLRMYTSDTIPGWNGTFLMTTLKNGTIYQLTLDDNGTSLAKEPVKLFNSENRYRDIAFGPDGSTIYVITDSSGPVQPIGGGASTDLWNPGSLIEFKYTSNQTAMQNQLT